MPDMRLTANTACFGTLTRCTKAPLSCTSKTLPDGSLLIDLVTATDYWGFYGYQIDVVRPDGVTISLAVGNGILSSQPGVTPAVTRAVPPGSFGEWNAVAESPIWHL